jgi:hypothetical protein
LARSWFGPALTPSAVRYYFRLTFSALSITDTGAVACT